jgi:hypothetical protein
LETGGFQDGVPANAIGRRAILTYMGALPPSKEIPSGPVLLSANDFTTKVFDPSSNFDGAPPG